MSNYNDRGQQLIDELLTDSTKFYEEGKFYDLLQEYFEGFPLNTLRALLSNEDHMVKRVAIWVVAECASEESKSTVFKKVYFSGLSKK